MHFQGEVPGSDQQIIGHPHQAQVAFFMKYFLGFYLVGQGGIFFQSFLFPVFYPLVRVALFIQSFLFPISIRWSGWHFFHPILSLLVFYLVGQGGTLNRGPLLNDLVYRQPGWDTRIFFWKRLLEKSYFQESF